MNNHPSLILKGISDDALSSPIARKVKLIANKVNISIVCEIISIEECTRLSHLAKSLVLLVYLNNNNNVGEKDNDERNNEPICIASSRSMLRMIATVNNAANTTNGLLGKSIVDDAIIDGWLSFIWISIELPLQTLLDDTTTMDLIDRDDIGNQIKESLSKVERHLLTKKNKSHHHESERRERENHHHHLYMVGVDGYTLADYSLAVSLYFMLINDIVVSSIMTSEVCPQLYLWYQTISPTIIDNLITK
mmetsp:Transcript_63/g.59  ORF Transcript_63/g.59 Transcript_63/m.59 type:complete len:249 (-) Transcript_63:478-1224(-)